MSPSMQRARQQRAHVRRRRERRAIWLLDKLCLELEARRIRQHGDIRQRIAARADLKLERGEAASELVEPARSDLAGNRELRLARWIREPQPAVDDRRAEQLAHRRHITRLRRGCQRGCCGLRLIALRDVRRLRETVTARCYRRHPHRRLHVGESYYCFAPVSEKLELVEA